MSWEWAGAGPRLRRCYILRPGHQPGITDERRDTKEEDGCWQDIELKHIHTKPNLLPAQPTQAKTPVKCILTSFVCCCLLNYACSIFCSNRGGRSGEKKGQSFGFRSLVLQGSHTSMLWSTLVWNFTFHLKLVQTSLLISLLMRGGTQRVGLYRGC